MAGVDLGRLSLTRLLWIAFVSMGSIAVHPRMERMVRNGSGPIDPCAWFASGRTLGPW